jgi:hypothetical protein
MTMRTWSHSKGDRAQSVIDLYKLTLEGKRSKADWPRDVRQVALGLVVLRQLVDNYKAELAGKSADWRANSAIAEADAIIEALVTGHAHPIWDHINSLRSGDFRPQHAPVTRIERQRQLCLIGAIYAYSDASAKRHAEARRIVLESVPSNDFSFTTEQVRKWMSRLADDPGWREYAEKIKKRAGELNSQFQLDERILAAGRELIWEMWSVPVIKPDG